jgi:putative tryptophan/tyrosine transport system substrate-binding protein
VIGVLNGASIDDTLKEAISAFRRGLSETGYIEGRDVIVEYRSAEGQTDRLPKMAAELIDRPASVIFAGSGAAAVAAKAVSSTVPIVFAVGGDQSSSGLSPISSGQKVTLRG